MKIINRLLAFLAQNEIVDHTRPQRTRTIERQHSNNVFKAVRRKLLQKLLHPVTFHLENRSGVGVAQNLISSRVVKLELVQIKVEIRVTLVNGINRVLNNCQVTQAQEVKFHQTD